MMSSTTKAIWQTMVTDSNAKGEHNDCTVKALTAATGLDYDVCHDALAKLGRRNRRGCNWMTLGPKAAENLGFRMERMDHRDYSAKTMITVERDRAFRNGHYVIQVSHHVAAVIDGKVCDWSQGRRKRVQAVYCCTPIAGYAAPVSPEAGPLPTGPEAWQSFRKFTKRDNLELF